MEVPSMQIAVALHLAGVALVGVIWSRWVQAQIESPKEDSEHQAGGYR